MASLCLAWSRGFCVAVLCCAALPAPSLLAHPINPAPPACRHRHAPGRHDQQARQVMFALAALGCSWRARASTAPPASLCCAASTIRRCSRRWVAGSRLRTHDMPDGRAGSALLSAALPCAVVFCGAWCAMMCNARRLAFVCVCLIQAANAVFMCTLRRRSLPLSSRHLRDPVCSLSAPCC